MTHCTADNVPLFCCAAAQELWSSHLWRSPTFDLYQYMVTLLTYLSALWIDACEWRSSKKLEVRSYHCTAERKYTDQSISDDHELYDFVVVVSVEFQSFVSSELLSFANDGRLVKFILVSE